MSARRDINIDLIRALSCIGVLGLHCFQEHLMSINLIIYRLCGFAIPMFFVTSGYFLVLTKHDIKNCLRRISKVCVIIILWNLLFWFILQAKNLLATQNISFIELPTSILKGLIQQGRFWHFWYLAALMLVYAVLPFINRFMMKSQKRRLLGLWLIFLTIGVLLQLLSEFAYHKSVQRLVVQPLRLWTWLQYFLLGGVLRIYRDKWNGKRKESLIAMIGLTVIAQLWQMLMGNQIHVLYGEAFYDSITTVLWVSALFIFVMNLNITTGLTRFVEVVAPCTMGIYIIHPLIIRYMKRVLFPDTFMKSLALFIILTGVSFGITYVMKRIPGLKKLVSL